MAIKPFVPESERPELLSDQMQSAIEQLSLIEKHAVVIGGAVLQLHGIRQTYDIDVLVSQSFYDFIATHKVFGKEKAGYRKWSHGFYKPVNVDRLPFDPGFTGHNPRQRLRSYLTTGFTDDTFPIDFEEALESIEPVNGIPALSLEKVSEWKEAVGRPVDLADVALINQVVGRQ